MPVKQKPYAGSSVTRFLHLPSGENFVPEQSLSSLQHFITDLQFIFLKNAKYFLSVQDRDLSENKSRGISCTSVHSVVLLKIYAKGCERQVTDRQHTVISDKPIHGAAYGTAR